MRRYVLVTLAVVAAAGCSTERAGSLPAAPSTTATPSATAAPLTAEAQVEAAARAYYAALELAGTTGDVAALRAAVDPGCDCARQVATLEAEHEAGRRVTTHYVVDGLATHDVTASSGWATVTLTYAPSQIVDAGGRVVRTVPGKTRVGRDLLFRKEGTAWRLTRLVLLG